MDLERREDWGFFLGNKLGCIGETSHISLSFRRPLFNLYWSGIVENNGGYGIRCFFHGAADSICLHSFRRRWRCMGIRLLSDFQPISIFCLVDWHLDLCSWQQILSLLLVFPIAKYIFGAFCGIVAIVIRTINPCISRRRNACDLNGQTCFAPLFDYYAVKFTRTRRFAPCQSNSCLNRANRTHK